MSNAIPMRFNRGADFFHSNYNLNINKQMKVPKGHHTYELKATKAWSCMKQELEMNVPDRILDVDQKQHIDTKALKEIESEVMYSETPIVRCITHPRGLTLGTHYYPAADNDIKVTSPQELKESQANPRHVRYEKGKIIFMVFCFLLATAAAESIRKLPTAKIASSVQHGSTKLGHAALDLYDDLQLVSGWYVGDEYNLRMSISIKVDELNRTLYECNLNISASIGQIRRLSYISVLIPLHEDEDNDENEISDKKPVKLMILYVKSCKHHYVYDGSFPTSTNYYVIPSADVSSSNFTMIVHQKKDHIWNRLIFGPKFSTVQYRVFNLTLGSHAEKVVPLKFVPNLIGVNFIDGNGTFRSHLYDLSGTPPFPPFKELFYLPHYETDKKNLNYVIVSSTLSFCWRPINWNPTSIQCNRYGLDGKRMFEKEISKFPDIMSFIKVEEISNGLILLSRKQNCYDHVNDECSIMYVTVVMRKVLDPADNPFPVREGHIAWHYTIRYCSFDTKCGRDAALLSAAIDEFDDGSFEIRFLCKTLEHFFHGFHNVRRDDLKKF